MQLGKLMYKWSKGDLPKALNKLFEQNINIHHYNTRNAFGPHRIKIHTEIVNKSFLVKAPKFWDTISLEIRSSTNYNQFKNRLKRYLVNMEIN